VKGFVPTPPHVVDDMVERLFGARPPSAGDGVLDPGCGEGAFIEGIVRWCSRRNNAIPRIVGIESNPIHAAEARRRFAHLPSVTILQEDFLIERADRFEYAIGNPPYVPITGLSVEEKTTYRRRYLSASGRFDLYLLFFEQALRQLKPGARLVFITPEKFLYVQSAEALRKQLASVRIEEIDFAAEATFGELVTYPVVTTIVNEASVAATRVRLRDGGTREVHLNGRSWLPVITGSEADAPQHTLSDACRRISCGVATGADGVYVVRTSELPEGLRGFAYPTVAGREIEVGKGMTPAGSMLVPYAPNGSLLAEDDLGGLGDYLRQPDRHGRLLGRTCAAFKPWYAFHETPPLQDILQPKILCKDISSQPYFLVDETGALVPRHSVYYIVPSDPSRIHALCEYLNSETVTSWLLANCQRAANGFVRLQSHVLKNIPVPAEFASTLQFEMAGAP
jgi:methylase of polypeptide subunit release factors